MSMGTEQRQAISELIYRSCLALDAGDYKGYLALCTPDFHYTVSTYSPEIKREMVWLDQDRKGMETLFTNLPRHNSDHSPLTRHATVYTVEANGTQAKVVSALQVFRTQLDGGATELFAVGRFHDTVTLDGGSPRLARRVVRLDTRELGFGNHVPF
jgi:methanesulfonate monooxygenase small subunit